MRHHEYSAGTDIFVEKDGGKNFYILINGSVEVLIQGEVKSTLEKGATFGELALLNDSPRTATIRAKTDTTCWALDKTVFRDFMKKINKQHFEEISQFVEQVEMLQLLSMHQRDQLISALVLHKFEDGEIIIHEGDPGELFYIVKEGEVVCTV